MPLRPTAPLAKDFASFRAEGGDLLTQHARFEALHGARLREDRAAWSWRDWPAEWRDPQSRAVLAFAAEHEREVTFHIFLQWLIARSLAAAQRAGRAAGMRVGLIADLAIGMDGGGSHAWSRQSEVLVGACVGAPPDYYNANGQNWGLTTFSPLALAATGFSPFIATLSAAMRYAGGLRIDHVMGLARLWLIPDGARPTEGAYVAFPARSLFHLIALESFRHRAIVIGEDLGTLPYGFRGRLDEEGLAGLQVLRFERDERGFYRGPETYRQNAVAMASTHDLPPTAGWWAGHDIEMRGRIAGFASEDEIAGERASRTESRHFLWGALRHAGAASGDEPPPDADGCGDGRGGTLCGDDAIGFGDAAARGGARRARPAEPAWHDPRAPELAHAASGRRIGIARHAGGRAQARCDAGAAEACAIVHGASAAASSR